METDNISLSTYLFAQPSFLSGIGTVLDLTGTLHTYNDAPTEAQADIVALSNDWIMVGADLRAAMNQYAEQSTIAAG